MPAVPAYLLKKIYRRGSLRNVPGGFELGLKNHLASATVVGVAAVQVDGKNLSLAKVTVALEEGTLSADAISPDCPVTFVVNRTVVLRVAGEPLSAGAHKLAIAIVTREAGTLEIVFTDTV